MNEKNSMLTAVGRKISRLRKERGITLSKLAELAGISKSTLSAIESGVTNPTISTLWAIADALNVPFGELLPEDFKEVDESGISVRLIERSEGKPKIEVYKMVLSPKSVRRAKPHQRGVIEKIFVVDGSMLAGSITSPKLLKAGDEIEFRADVPHVYIAMDGGATAIIMIKYPMFEDFYSQDIVKQFPEKDAEWDDLRTLLSRLGKEVLLGVPAFRIELRGSYTKDGLRKLKDILHSLRIKNLKYYLVEDNHRVLIYIFSIFPKTKIFDLSSLNNGFREAMMILKLSKKWQLSEDELRYLQNLANGSSFLLSVLASEALLIHGYPMVPKVIFEIHEFKPLRPGYARQALFIAYFVKRYLKNNRFHALGVGTCYHLRMLRELIPHLSLTKIENYSFECNRYPLIISIDFHRMDILTFLQKSYDLLEDNGILIVSSDFVSPYKNRMERARSIISHHTKYMLETLVDVPEDANLTDEEKRFVELLSKNVPLISYLLEIGETRTAISYVFQLFKDLSKISIPSKISHPLVSYYILQHLELSEIVASLDYDVERKTYAERFKSLAEELGFSLLNHTRIHAIHGTNEMDAGIHIFVLKKEV